MLARCRSRALAGSWAAGDGWQSMSRDVTVTILGLNDRREKRVQYLLMLGTLLRI